MSKIDIYKALEILDKFDFFQGQRAGRELWAEKPFDVQEEDLKNFSLDVSLLKTYIEESASETKLLYVELGNANSEILRLIEEKKELTEENERLENALIEQSAENVMLCGEVKHARADTVKKMQDMFAVHFGTYTDKDTVKVLDVFKLIDQIAREIMEEEK